MRRTKIVATIGPASSSDDALRAVLTAGADVVRLNAAHGTPELHADNAARARAIAAELGQVVGVLIDLPGPKMRTGEVSNGEVELTTGQRFTLCGNTVTGGVSHVSTTLPELARWSHPGDEIFLADGAIVLRVEAVEGDDVETRVVRGGVLRSRKGMHMPRAEARVEPFTEADEASLALAVRIKADFVGLSFVRRPEDVDQVRVRLPKRGARPHLVAKIETASALDHLAGIVASADAVMVARGDLGIQVPARRVPLLQKEIIRFCNMAGKPVITATQMLESMTRSPLPTRAEVNDVANAVLDGSDALMLSEETAVGDAPAEAVRTMAEVAESAEAWPRLRHEPATVQADDDRVAWAVAHAAVQAAEDLSVAAIVCPTRTGATARRVAAFRPSMPVVGVSTNADVPGRLSLVWGVRPLPMPDVKDPAEERRVAVTAARESGLVHSGDFVALVFGAAGPRAGSTDSVRIVRA